MTGWLSPPLNTHLEHCGIVALVSKKLNVGYSPSWNVVLISSLPSAHYSSCLEQFCHILTCHLQALAFTPSFHLLAVNPLSFYPLSLPFTSLSFSCRCMFEPLLFWGMFINSVILLGANWKCLGRTWLLWYAYTVRVGLFVLQSSGYPYEPFVLGSDSCLLLLWGHREDHRKAVCHLLVHRQGQNGYPMYKLLGCLTMMSV
jgi:hypothetical protein